MAISLFVEPVINLRAVVSTSSLRVVSPQFRAAATAIVSRPVYAATVSYPLYQTSIDYRRLTNSIYFRDLQAADVILDPDTKNRYFKDLDFVSFLDLQAIETGKSLTDTFGFSEADTTAIGYSSAKTDEFGFVDFAFVSINFFRDFDESFGFADGSTWDVNKGIDEPLPHIDQIDSKFVGKTLADLYSVEDLPALHLSRPASDSYSVSDTYAAVITFNRGFSETITALSDTRPVLDLGLGPADLIPVLESLFYDFVTSTVDQATVSDASSIDYSRPEADGVTTSDTFNRVVVFSRVFADAFALDDNATVGGVIKDTQTAKNNVFGFTDQHAYDFGKNLGDSVALAEVTSRIYEKGLEENVSLVETVLISKSSAASSVFNAAAFNISPLNN